MKIQKSVLTLTLFLICNINFAQKAYDFGDSTYDGSSGQSDTAIGILVQEITQSDFNYLNKGYWELAANGYAPREDIVLTEVSNSTIKVDYSDKIFIVNKVCKNGTFVGFIVSVKANTWDNKMYNIFLFEYWNIILLNHNDEMLKMLSKNSSLAFAFLKMITSTTLLINTYNDCGN